MENGIIPLFTLDTLLLPEDQMMMRIFEPRYKQMLDDIALDGLLYGHVISTINATIEWYVYTI